jgi:hypothetical protein
MRYLLVFVIITSISFAQSQKPLMTRSQYNSQKDSLLKVKNNLLEEKESLKNEIGELTKELVKISDPNLRRQICREYIIKKYGRKIGNRILNGQVWKGMTEEMLRDSYGEPDKVNRNKKKWGNFAQYYYGKQIFFFKNGKLFDWEQ